MLKKLSEQERQKLFKVCLAQIRAMPECRLLGGKEQRVFADRLVEIAQADMNGEKPPVFPPEGYEVVITKKDGKFATLVGSDDQPIGTALTE